MSRYRYDDGWDRRGGERSIWSRLVQREKARDYYEPEERRGGRGIFFTVMTTLVVAGGVAGGIARHRKRQQELDAAPAALTQIFPDARTTMGSIAENFTGALPVHKVLKAVTAALETRGFRRGHTTVCTSCCPDQIGCGGRAGAAPHAVTHGLVSHFGGPLVPLGGLAGVPFGGKTAWGALAHHLAEDDPSILLIYGPHVGVDTTGAVGAVDRAGCSFAATSCGAALAAHQAAVRTGRTGGMDVHDMEQGFLVSQLCARLLVLDGQPGGLAYANYEIIRDYLKRVVHLKYAARVAVLGGVYIDAGGTAGDHFLPLCFQVHDPLTGRAESPVDLVSTLSTDLDARIGAPAEQWALLPLPPPDASSPVAQGGVAAKAATKKSGWWSAAAPPAGAMGAFPPPPPPPPPTQSSPSPGAVGGKPGSSFWSFLSSGPRAPPPASPGVGGWGGTTGATRESDVVAAALQSAARGALGGGVPAGDGVRGYRRSLPGRLSPEPTFLGVPATTGGGGGAATGILARGTQLGQLPAGRMTGNARLSGRIAGPLTAATGGPLITHGTHTGGLAAAQWSAAKPAASASRTAAIMAANAGDLGTGRRGYQ